MSGLSSKDELILLLPFKEGLTNLVRLPSGSRRETTAREANDMDLPSPPQGGLVSAPSDASTEATMPSCDLGDERVLPEGQQPRFARGQKVLYDSFEQALPVRGTVAKMDCGGELRHESNGPTPSHDHVSS